MIPNHLCRRLLACVAFLLFGTPHPVAAQLQTASSEAPSKLLPNAPSPAEGRADTESPADTATTMFPHSDSSRYLISGQANIIFQAHGPFHSPYESTNSLLSRGEYKTSLLGTLYLGAQVIRNPKFNLDAIFDLESAGGRGDSEALGLAGFTNLDVVRNPNLGSTPYMARVQLHQTIGLSNTMVDAERTPFSLATKVPQRRLEFHIGKMGLPDFFDNNTI